MKLSTFGVLAVAGMTATSVGVWSLTGGGGSAAAGLPAGAPQPSTVAPSPVEPAPEPVDESVFHAAGTLAVEGRLGHAVIPATTDSETYLYLDVKADPAKEAAVQAPLNVAIVIDRSGSMKGVRIRNALAAARTMVERMRDGDSVTVVAYNTASETLVPPTIMGPSSRETVLRGLRSLRATGDTCISCGLEAGMRLLGQTPGRVSRILLLSDGKATAGVRDEAGFRQLAERCRQMSVSISSIGVDVDYNERIMAAVARESNGRHYFVADASGLPQVFDREMESLKRTVAANAEISIDLGPGVFIDNVFDRAFRQVGSRVVVPLGTFANTDSKTVLARVRVPRGPAGERLIAHVQLAYSDLATGDQGTSHGRLIAEATADLTAVSRIDGLVSARLSRSETAALLETANELARSGRFAEAQSLVRDRRAELSKRKREARDAAPRGRRGDLEADFAVQGGVLAAADEGFAAPPPAADPAAGAGAPASASGPRPARAEPRKPQVQIRANQQAAFDLAE